MNEIAKYSSLEDKVIIITGGASGIGASIVEQFLQQGSKVAFLDKEQDLGNSLVEKLSNFKHPPLFKHCDLTNIDSLKKTINEIREEVGLVSILVNNAANDERHSIESVTEEFWDDRMNVNLRHYFFAAQSVYKDMKELGWGTIVNIGSFSWMIAQGGMPGYTTAKSAVMGLTRTLARDLGVYNVRVNCISPAGVYKNQDSGFIKKLAEQIPMGRMALPNEFKGAIVFLASNASSFITGHNLLIDGGRTIW